MNRGLTASFFAHGLLLLLVLFGLPNSKLAPLEPQQAIQVDISNIGDVTKVKATTTQEVPKQAEPAPKKTEVTQEVKPAPKVDDKVVEAAKEKQPEPKPEPKHEPKPEPKPEPPKAEDKPVDDTALADLLKDQAEAEKKAAEEAALAEKKAAEEKKKADEAKKKAAEAKKIADAKKKAEEEKKKQAKKFDVAELEKMLNKENDERTAPQKSSDKNGSPDKGKTEAQGDDAEVAATLVDAFRSKLAECWNVPAGAREAAITVKLQFSLRRDKTVEGLPVVLSGGGFQEDLPVSYAGSAPGLTGVLQVNVQIPADIPAGDYLLDLGG